MGEWSENPHPPVSVRVFGGYERLDFQRSREKEKKRKERKKRKRKEEGKEKEREKERKRKEKRKRERKEMKRRVCDANWLLFLASTSIIIQSEMQSWGLITIFIVIVFLFGETVMS